MLDAGVSTRRGIMCSHREPVYTNKQLWSCDSKSGDCNCPPGSCKRLHESERAQDHGIILPLYHQMTEEDQIRVVQTLKTACNAN